jgi:NADH dehydrogenase [ubiquinone] 1 alpha subcomplex assembly factor 5
MKNFVKFCKQGVRRYKQDMFDKEALRVHKKIYASQGKEFDYLRDEMAWNVVDRLECITKKFPMAVEVNSGKNILLSHLAKDQNGIQQLILQDDVPELVETPLVEVDAGKFQKIHRVLGDAEAMPYKSKSLDLCIAVNHLHFVNGMEDMFKEFGRVLKPDGVLIGALLGDETLFELRSSLMLAEQEREGGISAHISPTIGIRDLGNVISAAGFNLPTVDSDSLTVYYPDIFVLMKHLQSMGENNILSERRGYIPPETWLAAASIYEKMYGTEQGIPATFEILYFIAWTPDPSQPKAAKRGSAKVSMKDLATDLKTSLHNIEE